MAGTSRMNREVHVRNCEGLEVQFLGPTRPFEAALQGEASNSHKLLRAKPAVVNVMVKRRGIDHVM